MKQTLIAIVTLMLAFTAKSQVAEPANLTPAQSQSFKNCMKDKIVQYQQEIWAVTLLGGGNYAPNPGVLLGFSIACMFDLFSGKLPIEPKTIRNVKGLLLDLK